MNEDCFFCGKKATGGGWIPGKPDGYWCDDCFDESTGKITNKDFEKFNSKEGS